MRIPFLKLIIICLIVNLSSCKTPTEINNPEGIGKQVFSIIKKLQDNTKDNYLNNFLKVEELREFASNKDFEIEEKIKNEITSLTREKYFSSIEKKYNKIKEDAISYGIEFDKITYLDFIYKTKKEGGLIGYEGIVFFKYKGETYKIETASIDIGKKIGLIEIKNLLAK